MAGQAQEHVVERRPAQADVEDFDALVLQTGQDRLEVAGAPGDRGRDATSVVFVLDVAEREGAEDAGGGVAL